MATTQIFDEKYYPRKEVDPSKAGTHMQKSRPRGGWPNTAAPLRDEARPGKRKIRRALKQLKARNADFDQRGGKNREKGNHIHVRPGSLKCR